MSKFGTNISSLYGGGSAGTPSTGVTSITATSPLTANGVAGGVLTANGNLGIQVATASQNGYLTSTDFNRFSVNDFLYTNTQLGGTFKSQSLSSFSSQSNAQPVTQNSNGALRLTAIFLPITSTISGVAFYITTQTNHTTSSGFNGFAVYSLSGTTLSRILVSADNPNNWIGKTSFNWHQINFTGTQVLQRGIYWIAGLCNLTGGSVAPNVLGSTNALNSAQNLVFGTNNKLALTLSGQTTMPITISMTAGGSLVSGNNISVFLV
jgi:hypothetical protein